MPEAIAEPPAMIESADVESLSRLFEQLCVDNSPPVDRQRIRRAVQGAMTAWPGLVEDQWWRWVIEAGTSLELRCSVVDATPAELAELVDARVILVLWTASDREWVGLSGHGRRLRIIGDDRVPKPRSVRVDQAEAFLAGKSSDGWLRCVTAERLAGPRTVALEPISPWDRLKHLLQPEVGDIGVVTVFAVVSGVLALATPIAVESLVNTVAFGRLVQPILVLTLVVLCVLSFGAAMRALQTYVVEIVQQRLFARIAIDLAWRLPRIDTEASERLAVGEMVNRFLDVVTLQKTVSQLLLDGIAVVLGTLIGMSVLAFYHPWLLAMDAFLLLLMVTAVTVLGRGAVSTSIMESKYKYKVANWLDELARCSMTFKHVGANEFALDRADHLARDYLAARQGHFRILMRQVLFTLGLQAVASTVLLGLGGWLVMSGQLTIGQLVAAELIVTAIVSSFAKMGKLLDGFYDLLAAVDKLGTLFDLPVERPDGLLCPAAQRPIEVDARGLCYSYDDGRSGLDRFSIGIRAGERVALISTDSTSGSTFLDLVFGLRHPADGYLTLDSVDPRDVRPDFLRRKVCLIRNIEVFHGTIAENVHLNRTDVSMQQVREALTRVGLLDDVLRLPHGLETHLNRDGIPFTESQQVRLMVARALVSSPALLLIDGILDRIPDRSAVDLVSELCDQRNPWTLIVVTGRRAIADRLERTVRLAADDLTVDELSQSLGQHKTGE